MLTINLFTNQVSVSYCSFHSSFAAASMLPLDSTASSVQDVKQWNCCTWDISHGRDRSKEKNLQKHNFFVLKTSKNVYLIKYLKYPTSAFCRMCEMQFFGYVCHIWPWFSNDLWTDLRCTDKVSVRSIIQAHLLGTVFSMPTRVVGINWLGLKDCESAMSQTIGICHVWNKTLPNAVDRLKIHTGASLCLQTWYRTLDPFVLWLYGAVITLSYCIGTGEWSL